MCAVVRASNLVTCSNSDHGSYRNLTVVFETFPGQNYFFFQTFQGILFKNITKLAFNRWNFLYNVFFYSQYRMGLKFFNSELQMLCAMNCKKINTCLCNQQCNRHLHFPGQHYSFQGFFQTFLYLWSFPRLFKALKSSKLNSRTFHTFPGSVRTLSDVYNYAATKRNAFIFYDELKINQAHSVSKDLMPRLIRSRSHSRFHNPDSRSRRLPKFTGNFLVQRYIYDKIFINIRSVLFFPEIWAKLWKSALYLNVEKSF